MRIPARMWPGIEFVLLGLIVCCGTEYWYQSRVYTALDIPIVLHHGHVVTPEFGINLAHDYMATISTGEGLYAPSGPCPDYSAMQSQVALERNGKPVPDTSPMTPQVITAYYDPAYHQFHANGGRYRLDFNFLGDPTCANSKDTRLVVEITPWDVDHVAALRASIEFFVALALVAGAVVLFGAYAHPIEPSTTTVGLASALTAGATAPRVRSEIYKKPRSDAGDRLLGWSPLQVLRTRRWSTFGNGREEARASILFPILVRDPAKSIPTASMVCAIFFWAFVPVWIALYSSMHYRHYGLLVRVMGPRTVVGSELAGETLSVWIDEQNRWYFNARPTTQEELPGLLRESLARRASQVVYVDADANVDFMVVARAIGIVRGEHARVILITTAEGQGSSPTAGRSR